MPERLRVKEMLVERVTGRDFDYYDETPKALQPLADALDDMYLQIVDRVDWSRVLLIAQGRCLHLKHRHSAGETCGQSVRDAMCCVDGGAYDFKGKDHYERPKHLDRVKEICKANRKRKFGKDE